MNNQISIEEKKTIYDISYKYRSEMKNQDYDVYIEGIEEDDGKISLKPLGWDNGGAFQFVESDPDRVIAIAQMLMAFAQMVKNKNNEYQVKTENDNE